MNINKISEENLKWLKMVGYLLLVVQGIVAFMALIMFTSEVGAVINNSGEVVKSNIRDYGDAYWCTFTSATSIGYGDHFPITVIGKFVGGSMYYIGQGVMDVIGAMVGFKIMQFFGIINSQVENEELKEQNATIIKQNEEQEQRDSQILKSLDKLKSK